MSSSIFGGILFILSKICLFCNTNSEEVRKVPIHSKKIKERIKELRLTQGDAAKALGLAQPTVNQKINNVRSMSVDEAEKLARLLKIRDQDFCIYFCMRLEEADRYE